MNKTKIILAMFLISGFAINAQSLDLNGFITKVKEHNKDIQIAKYEREIAETQSTEASSNALPQLNAEASYRRNLKDNFMYIDFPSDDFPDKLKINYKNEFSAQAVLSQTLFNYTVFNAIKAARQYEKLTDYTFDATLQGVLCGSKKVFHQTLLLKKVWEVSQAAEKSAMDNYLQVKKKFDSGLASKFEMMQAEVRWQNLIPETTQAERNYNLAINSVKSLAGIPLDDIIVIDGDLEKYPNKPQLIDLRTALSSRPDYNAMVQEKDLRTTNIDVEMSAFYPSLYASMVYAFNSTSDEFNFDRENHTVQAGLTLRVPIFSGFSRTAKLQRAKIEVEQSKLRINKFEEQVDTDLKNIQLRLEEAVKRINSAEKTMGIAEQANTIAETSSVNGLITQLELKDARLTYDQAQLGYYAAVYDYLDAYFDWEQATGQIK